MDSDDYLKSDAIEIIANEWNEYRDKKDICGSESYNYNGIIQRAIRKIKEIDFGLSLFVCLKITLTIIAVPLFTNLLTSKTKETYRCHSVYRSNF